MAFDYLEKENVCTKKCTNPYISVVICTWNRSNLLSRCIDSILSQTLDFNDFEIIVVDNNSTDDTKKTVESISDNSQVAVRYVFEPEQGLSYARNTGVKEARGDVIWFIDDDAIAGPNALKGIKMAFDTTDADMIGGAVKNVIPANRVPDVIFKDMENSGLYLGSEMRVMYDNEFTWGGNMAVRREIFNSVGYFDTNLGCKGKQRIVGEDTEFCQRVRASGKKIYWVPTVSIDHCPDPARLSIADMRRNAFYYGISQINHKFKGKFGTKKRIVISIKCVMQILFYGLAYIVTIWHKNLRYRHSMHIYRCIGKLNAALR